MSPSGTIQRSDRADTETAPGAVDSAPGREPFNDPIERILKHPKALAWLRGREEPFNDPIERILKQPFVPTGGGISGNHSTIR